jgi:hypothetical protein
VRNDYPFPLDADFYQIERQSIVSGLRRAHVGVGKRRDGSVAVSFGERYLPVSLCAVAEKTKASPVKPASSRRPRTRQQGSEWRKNFNWKKRPKIWLVAQHSDYNRSSADGAELHRNELNYFQNNSPGGTFSFDNAFTSVDPLSPGATGSGLASFEQGVPTGASYAHWCRLRSSPTRRCTTGDISSPLRSRPPTS